LLPRKSRPRAEGRWPKGRGPSAVFFRFAIIGATAFGGGSATNLAIRQMCVHQGWLTEQEFLDVVVLSRVTPGTTILAEVLLIGRRVCGVRGMVAAVLGMLIPAVAVTIGLSAVYDVVSRSSAATLPLRCVIGAAAGFSLAMMVLLTRDTLRRNRPIRGPLIFLAYVGLGLLVHDPVIVIAVALVLGALCPSLFPPRADDDEP
jgi:chromate transporter